MRVLLLLTLGLFLSCSRREEHRPVRAEPEPAVVPRVPAAGATQARVPNAGARRVALVELFTSQGCSSCPSADENLARISHAARADGRPIIALSFHVDYWDYLGWKDPFSDARFSARQKRYARLLGSNVYTPQLVINGRAELLGSRAAESDAAIERALESVTTHTLSVGQVGDGRFVVQVSGPARDATVSLAVAQSASGVAVSRGENAGRTLGHVNVVRGFSSRALSLPGEARLDVSVPADAKGGHAVLVAWAQAEDGGVLGATATSLRNTR